jgi:hypothetical protein
MGTPRALACINKTNHRLAVCKCNTNASSVSTPFVPQAQWVRDAQAAGTFAGHYAATLRFVVQDALRCKLAQQQFNCTARHDDVFHAGATISCSAAEDLQALNRLTPAR